MRGRIHLLLLTIMLVSSSLSAVAAQDASPAATPAANGSEGLASLGYPELALTTDGTSLDVPAELEAGRYHVSLTNTGDLTADLELYQVPEGITTDDMLAAFDEPQLPEWFYEMVSNGGVSTAPDSGDEAILDLTPGEWLFNLYTFDEEFTTTENLPVTVTVTGEMPVLEDPEAAVEAVMIDYDFQLTTPIPAGPNLWKIANEGEEPHHVVITQVPEGTTEEQVVEFAGSFYGPPATPEVPASPASAGLSVENTTQVYWTSLLSSGMATWVEIDLEPGTYAVICFIPAPDGTPHVMLGMVEMITVEE